MRRALTKELQSSIQATELSTRHKLPLLISYAYLRDNSAETIERILTNPYIELLLDSGAFTAMNAGYEIKLDEYIEFLHKWRNNLFGYMALDKLQDPVTTDKNLRVMLDAGLKPIPVHVYGDTERRMDELFELSDWVALGGFRRPHRGPAPGTYVKLKMRWAKNRNVHWLGYTSKPMVQAFRPFSCDCSSWMSGAMYGRLAVYVGRGKWVNHTLSEMRKTRAYNLPELRRALSEYDIPLADYMDERQWHNGNSACELKARDCVITKLPARSWVRYVLDLKQKFGTRLFIACHDEQVDWLCDAFEMVARKGLLDDKGFHNNTVRGIPSLAGRAGGSRVPA